jgi:hypothetical protein
MVAEPVECEPAGDAVEDDLGRHVAGGGGTIALEITNDDGHAGGAGATAGRNRRVLSHMPVAREKASRYHVPGVVLEPREDRYKEATT